MKITDDTVDGGNTASNSQDDVGNKFCRVWYTYSGSTLLTFPLKTYTIEFPPLAWSSVDDRIASTDFEITYASIHIWDVRTGETRLIFENDGDSLALAWSPDGRRLASGGKDQTVQVWDANTAANLLIYRGHFGATVTSISWSPDGTRIVSGDENVLVKVWFA